MLIGNDADRARVRAQLAGRGIEIVAEASTLTAARAGDVGADAFVLAAAESDRAMAEALTPRELEVLDLVAEGLSNQAIAARLSIAEATVKFHVAQLCGKLGAENRTDAVTRALRRGLISL